PAGAPCETRRIFGNILFDGGALDDLFTDLDELAIEPAFRGLFLGVGLDPTSLTCGTNESPRICAEVGPDLLGTERTTPFSLGAYQL
ncbi:MAG: hypothetical protein AAF658_06080, partial [Myxococcota bacterium]